jgi:RNAse (barnase) inhibitor barstar
MTDPVLTLCQVLTKPTMWVWSDGGDRPIDDAMYGWRDARLTVRTLRGRTMPREQRLFDELAAALQFPGYFGENWNAVHDCLTDMSWLPPEAGYVLVLTEPERVLEESSDALDVLVRVLTSAGTEWSTPVSVGEWWDRSAVPFHVVLATDPQHEAQVRSRWAVAGAHLLGLPV